MSLEALESRRLLSISVDSNHILQIKGTEANDNITLTDAGGKVQVAVNSDPPQTFDPATLSGYFIQGLGGNDGIVIWNVVSGATVYGGNGNDKIVGGDGNETLYGNAGKDQIDGRGGNDLLKGNGGNDKLFGNAGGDRLYGGLGNDYLDGGSSGDRIYGEGGNDTMLGQGGNDNLYAHDGAFDQVFGGSGTDTGIVDGIDQRGAIEQLAVI